MTDAKSSPTQRRASRTSGDVLSEEERAAMQETIRERKKAAKLSPEEARAQGEADVQAKIAEMADDDRAIAARIHELVRATAADLVPRTFYGMPAYAKDGKVICFFQAKSKFKVRYSTFGFQPDARLDDEELWPVAFAITKVTPAGEKRIAELIKKAAR
jgi:uncharacterized protein YdhG (YjbR/CyaY superfamily)